MAQIIDFNGLLRDLFQEDLPVGENLQKHPQAKRNGADFSRALGEIFQTERKSADCEHMNQDNNSPLQACNLYVFMREIIIEHFGMGYDYAFKDRYGNPLKSWFTIPEAIETAKSLGYKLTIAEAREYLDKLIKQRYIETDNYKYRRRAFWDKDMEKYLRRNTKGD